MDYRQTIRQIYDLQEFAIKLGLENILALSERLGNPHLKYPVIHLAGTNGKGSTAFFIQQLLQHHGLKSGLFTSPHLTDYRERIRIGDALIAPEFVVDFWRQNKAFILNHKATFFDTTTAMAFQYFAENKVDVAVIETGLGGRLDSTNIVQAQTVVLTPVDFDHQKQLGNTLTAIAREKAGIIKPEATVFSAPQAAEVLSEFLKHLRQLHLFHYLPDLLDITILDSSLDKMTFELYLKQEDRTLRFEAAQSADFQVQNLALAHQVAKEFLKKKGMPENEEKTKQVFATRFWPGRLQTVHQNPRIIFDVSHNLAGIKSTLAFVKKNVPANKIHLLIGLLEHKDFKNIVTFLGSQNLKIYLTEPPTEKRLPAKELEKAFLLQGKTTRSVNDPVQTIRQLKEKMQRNEVLLVMGFGKP